MGHTFNDNRNAYGDHFIRWPELHRRTGLSRSTVWRAERRGEFPRRHQLTPGTVGWLASDVEGWMHGDRGARDRQLGGTRLPPR